MRHMVYLLISISLFSCLAKSKAVSSVSERSHALRLLPGQDLRSSIQRYVNERNIQAGWIVTCAGSLTDYHIRFANATEGSKATGHFEIVSLTGTLSKNGSHMHISISDSTGKTIGGHLLEGCTVYTTAEIIITETSRYQFTRQKDGTTPWDELQIHKIGN